MSDAELSLTARDFEHAHPFVVPVNWFVSDGAPSGQTDLISVQLILSVDVWIGMPVPVAKPGGCEDVYVALRRMRGAPKMKYVPDESRHMVGSCTEMSPVTFPGLGCAMASAAKATNARMRVSMLETRCER